MLCWQVRSVEADGEGFEEGFVFPLFTRDRNGIQFHLAERDLTAHVRNGRVINPIDKVRRSIVACPVLLCISRL